MEKQAEDKHSTSQDDKVPQNPPANFFSETDMEYVGAQRFKSDYVYRACDIKDSEADVKSGDPDSNRSVEQHVHSGVTKPSRFISATKDLAIAEDWATKEMGTKEKALRDPPRDIIKIDMSKIQGTPEGDKFVDLTNPEVREHFLKHPFHQNCAKKSQEVLFYNKIPAGAYEILPGNKEPDESVDELTKAMGKAQIK